MQITSSAFQDNDPLPAKYTVDGDNVNPPLTFSEVPASAKSLALVLEDPDSPSGMFAHWIVYDIAPATLQIMEGALPINAVEGKNDHGEKDYYGPAPPSGTHRYVFKLFALDTTLDQPPDEETREVLYGAMHGHILESASITGTYSR